MNIAEFIVTWRKVEPKERSAASGRNGSDPCSCSKCFVVVQRPVMFLATHYRLFATKRGLKHACN